MSTDEALNQSLDRVAQLAIGHKRALERCLDVLLRMIPDLCAEHDQEPTTNDEHDEAIELAATALYGADRAAWPARVRDAADGKYE